MITEIGHFALVLALAVACIQAVLPLAGAERGNAAWMAAGRPAAVAQFLLILLAFLALTHAYVVSDFSVENVAQNSHSAKPLLYKITGVWGNHEGSLLLWALILALFGATVAGRSRNLPASLTARVLGVQAVIGVGFLLFILLTSNPFTRLVPAPLDGNDLNPLLQDPGLAFHPPFLYVGYVGFSMAFSFAVAALLEGRVDPAWARWVRPWTLAAWCSLTFGIAMGSWWAYYELGWGGWWYWDPVENASFMPWLSGTALLHSAIVVEKRDTLKAWTILLAILTFALSLIGTFLVRSGVLTSVHAFATDPERGLFILLLLVVMIGGSLMIFAARASALAPGGMFAPISRESGLVLNNLLLTAAMGTVFLGTLYPLILDVLDLGKISVGPPFFNATFVPLMVPALVLMVVGPMLAWKRGDLFGVLGRLKAAFAASAIAALIALYVAGGPSLAMIGLGLAGWVVVGSLVELAERVKLFAVSAGETWQRLRHLPRSAYGATLAHAGVGVLIAGVTASSAWKVESVQTMRPGDRVEIAGYVVTLDAVRPGTGPNYDFERAEFGIYRGDQLVTRLYPERRLYPVRSMPTSETGIHSTLLFDLYTVLGDRDPAGGWTTRVYFEPLIPWIWIGAVVMTLGGLVSLSDRRHRVGAPSRRRVRSAAAARA